MLPSWIVPIGIILFIIVSYILQKRYGWDFRTPVTIVFLIYVIQATIEDFIRLGDVGWNLERQLANGIYTFSIALIGVYIGIMLGNKSTRIRAYIASFMAVVLMVYHHT